MANIIKGGGGKAKKSGAYSGPWSGKGPYMVGGDARAKHPMLYGGQNAVTDERSGRSSYFSALAAQQAAYAAQMGQGQGDFGGGGGGGYGGGGYGGGGGGGGGRGGPDIGMLTGKLNSERDNARKALPGYLSTYNQGIDKVGRESAALTKGYSAQINQLMKHLLGQGNEEATRLQGDVGAQGGNGAGMRAAASQNQFGTQAIGGAQDAYNRRLAQVMGAATADRKATGQAVNMAANAGLDQSYMQALMALQRMA